MNKIVINECDATSDTDVMSMLESSRHVRFDANADPTEVFDKWPCLKEIKYVSLIYIKFILKTSLEFALKH